MSSERLRHLKRTEIALLQKRTDLQRQLERHLRTADWRSEDVDELSRQHDAVEQELAELRTELARLERGLESA